MIYNIFYILWNDYMKLIIISITSYTYSIVRTLKIAPLTNFQVYKHHYCIVMILYNRSPELIWNWKFCKLSNYTFS